MSYSVMKQFPNFNEITGSEVTHVCGLAPDNKGMQNWWVYLNNLINPLFKLKEKSSLRYIAVSEGKAWYLVLGEEGEVYSKVEIPLDQVSEVNVAPGSNDFEKILSFSVGGQQHSYPVWAYPMGSHEFSDAEKAECKEMCDQVLASFQK